MWLSPCNKVYALVNKNVHFDNRRIYIRMSDTLDKDSCIRSRVLGSDV